MTIPSYVLERRWLKSYPSDVNHDVDIPKIPLHEMFNSAASKYMSKTAMVFLGEKIDYRTLKDHSDRLSNFFSSVGIKKGERICLMLPNSPQFVTCYYGALQVGATVTPMNPLYTTREIEYQLNDSEAKAIVTLDILYEKVKKAKEKTQVRHIVVTNIADYLGSLKRVLGRFLRKIPYSKLKPETGLHFYRNIIKEYRPEVPKVEINPEMDTACLMYTGGTTGTPKGVILTHKNIVSNILQSHEFLKGYVRDGKEIMVALLPFFHIYGQTVFLGVGLCHGNTLLVFPRLEFERFLKTISEEKATIFVGVPSLYNAMVNYPKIKEVDLSSVRLFISGADKLHEEVAKRFESIFGKKICEGYGLTETSPVTHVNPPERIKIGSMGIPVPNTYAAVMDPEANRFLEPGEVGELAVSGPQVMVGYWNKPDETMKVITEVDGMRWLRTGDIVKVDEEGYFYFVERKRDLIKHKGYSVFPAEVEEVVYSHPAVKEVAVVGIPDPSVGEEIRAVVVLKSGYEDKVKAEDIIGWCKERLAPYKVPSKVEFTDELPKSMVGKVLRREVREKIAR